ADQQRVTDIAVSLQNFEQLQSVYASDIARLEAIEEAGFLFRMDAHKACPVCGAPPEAQVHDDELIDIEKARAAAELEIAKIRLHRGELARTTIDTQAELAVTSKKLLQSRNELEHLENELRAASPDAEEQQHRFSEI